VRGNDVGGNLRTTMEEVKADAAQPRKGKKKKG